MFLEVSRPASIETQVEPWSATEAETELQTAIEVSSEN